MDSNSLAGRFIGDSKKLKRRAPEAGISRRKLDNGRRRRPSQATAANMLGSLPAGASVATQVPERAAPLAL